MAKRPEALGHFFVFDLKTYLGKFWAEKTQAFFFYLAFFVYFGELKSL
jgi:hypothetical protein